MKPNPMLARIEAQHQLELKLTRDATRQEMVDCAMIALNRADTKDKEFAIARFEEILKSVCGENYSPREERYR